MPICEQLTVTPSTYYDIKSRPPCARQIRDEELGRALKDLWQKNYSVYGRRKLTKAARRRNLECACVFRSFRTGNPEFSYTSRSIEGRVAADAVVRSGPLNSPPSRSS